MAKVICNFCGKVYDLGKVKVIARYTDATCFETPCCGRSADDREWKSMPDFERMADGAQLDRCGNVVGLTAPRRKA